MMLYADGALVVWEILSHVRRFEGSLVQQRAVLLINAEETFLVDLLP